MRIGRQSVCCGAAMVVALSAAMAQGDVFNMAGGQTSLSFVTVGDANNPADPLTPLTLTLKSIPYGSSTMSLWQGVEWDAPPDAK